MSDDRRPVVPNDRIAVQYANGTYAVEFPGHDPITYRLDGQGRIQLQEGARGVELLRANRVQSTEMNIVNPYTATDTFAFRNNGVLELVPFSHDTHRLIREAAENNPGFHLQFNSLTNKLDRGSSDSLERMGRGQYAVLDVDAELLYHLPKPPNVPTPDQRDRTPQTTRGARD